MVGTKPNAKANNVSYWVGVYQHDTSWLSNNCPLFLAEA